MILSRQNPLIKLARSLHSAKNRRAHGLFLAEGPNSFAAIEETNWPIRAVLSHSENSHPKSHLVSDEILSYAAQTQSSPQILALAELPPTQTTWNLSELLVVADGISDPGNLGTIWRAADAAGTEKIVCSEGGAEIWSPKAVRSAAGSLFHLPPLNLENRASASLAQQLIQKNIPILTAEAHGGQNPFEFQWPRRCALVLGHETRGISPELQAASSAKLTIPIAGRAESLNVAMAGTLLLFAWRQSQGKR